MQTLPEMVHPGFPSTIVTFDVFKSIEHVNMMVFPKKSDTLLSVRLHDPSYDLIDDMITQLTYIRDIMLKDK